MFRNGFVAGLLNIIYGLLVAVSRQCWIVSGDVEFKAVIVRLSSDVWGPRSPFGKVASNYSYKLELRT